MDDPDKSKEKELEEEEDLDYIPDLASIQLPFDDNTLAKTFETGLDSLESWNEFIEFVSGRDVELKNYKDELHYGDTPKTSDPIVNRGRRASADSQISPFKAKSFEEVDASAEGIKGEILRQRRASYNKISTSQRSFVSLLSSQSNKILKSVGSDLLHESSNPTLRETNSSQLNVNEFGFEENTLINDKPTEKFMEDELDLEKRLRELDAKYVMEEKLLLSLENENKEMEQRFSRRSSVSSGTQIISRSASKHSNLSYSEIEVTEVDTKKPENNHSRQRSLPLINKENLELDEVMESEFENNTFLKKSSYFNKSCDSLETIMKDSVANQLKAEELEKREFLEKCQKLHSEEIALESELDRLLKSLESEKKKFEKLTYELEIFNANRGSYIRERKLLKSKIRLLQDKLKTIQQWIKIEGKGIFSREKDRATILLQKAQKILDQKNSKLVEIKKRKDHFMAISNNKRIVAVQVMTKSSELKTILNKIRQENIENCATIEKTETLIVEKKASRERQLLNRAQVEENRRKFEFDLLFQACNHQNPNIPLDFDQLRIFNINSMNLTRLPDLSPVPNLRFINMDHNAFTNLEGLNPVADLNYLTLNSNHINKLDLVSVKNIKHLEAAHNHISNVLGLANCKYLKWLDLSYNPIRSIDFLKEALSLKVLLIRSVMVPNFSSLSNLKNLMALDLGGNHIYNDPLLMIKEMHILQYLALDENSYTEVPDISNAMLFELRLEKNKLRTVNFVSFLPMLRILHLEHNSINNTTPFSMLPNLQELYLQENNLHGMKNKSLNTFN
ncbi:hypothetical protein HDU92_001025 [Lobulomyces angularis]|nr:hypothetical protein HDU92_001025 [Lobulomyces angularis]